MSLNRVVKWLASIKKTLVAVGNFLVTLAATLEDGSLDNAEYILVASAFLAILGVYQVTNLVGAVNRKK